ncbi:SDR family NAD(P)-dependent oxidoreductase [Pelagibacterium montanilacus]|uniref:SDR family NAD(P)-dependent oxidoreductase n=1 Tax=Pelagibacterium montanilacus TaxID=2185280 RepID=UPI000F8F2718|nr:glucose 1-dehydrogenase [Pelagibacterium montanilacus]
MVLPAAFDLTGRKALVTGASRGLGRHIALALARMGAEVAITARSDAGLADTMAAFASEGLGALPRALDVTDIGAIPEVVGATAEAMGGLDIVVNNAGIEEVTPSTQVSEAIWDRIVDTNLKGSFFVSQAAARLMEAAGTSGAMVNLCSLTSFVGVPTAVPYGASKSGLLGMTRALSAEWAPKGIRVNAIAPGYFRTEMTDVFYTDPAWQQTMLAKIPQGRFGSLEDVGGAVVFLCSDAAGYITGQCLGIDGGYLASI